MEAIFAFIVNRKPRIAPIKIAANYIGAQITGIILCIIAQICAAAIQKVVSIVIPQPAQIYSAVVASV